MTITEELRTNSDVSEVEEGNVEPALALEAEEKTSAEVEVTEAFVSDTNNKKQAEQRVGSTESNQPEIEGTSGKVNHIVVIDNIAQPGIFRHSPLIKKEINR